MRKISFEASHALLNKKTFRGSNTIVDKLGGTYDLSLHGNTIARYGDLYSTTKDDLEITSSGWFTATTKERLNALPGVHIQQKAGIWYLNGNVWDGRWTKIDTSK